MLYLIILLPLALGISSAFSRPGGSKTQTVCFLAVQAAELVAVIFAVTSGKAWETPPRALTESLLFSLRLDGLGAFFCLLTACAWLLTILYASVYMTHEGAEPRFYAFLFSTEAAVMGAALAADTVTFYLFFEMTTLLSAPLVLHDLTPKAVLGSIKYLYYSIGGAFAALFGIALFAVNGSVSFALGGTLGDGPLSPTLMAAAFCTVLGFGAKAGLYPLHNWLPAAHPVAPAPAHALLSGIIAKVGALGILRMIFFVIGVEHLRGTWVQYTAIVLALIGVAMGSFMGCVEMGLKKRLAYSSISQISYVLLGIFILTPHGVEGGLLQIFFHAAAKIGVFQCAGAVIFLTGKTRVDEFRGLGRRIPITTVCFTILSLSLVGIPPLGGFWSKWHLCLAALEGLPTVLSYLVPAVLILSALLTAGYLFAPIVSAFFPGEDCPAELTEPVKEPLAMVVSLIVFCLVCTVLGLYPAPLVSALEHIAGALM